MLLIYNTLEVQQYRQSLLSHNVDNWEESQFKTWYDYHYSICREQSVLGASNHVVLIGRKWYVYIFEKPIDRMYRD